MSDKSVYSDKLLVGSALKLLKARLPKGWQAQLVQSSPGAPLEIHSPGGAKARLAIQAAAHLFPRDINDALQRQGSSERLALFVAPFLSPSTRRRLRDLDQNYVDLTGNIRLAVVKPGLYVETPGADRDPAPAQKARRSLKGAKAGRLVRALCDLACPLTLSELASRAGVDAGYASRLLDSLAREALVTRARRGPIEAVDRAGLIRRWADDYSVLRSNSPHLYLDPRDLSTFGDRLARIGTRFAVTGSLGANKIAPVAPTRLMMVYVTSLDEASAALKLQPTEVGANVMLLLPFDDVVFERTLKRDGLTIVALSQLAADLLTSPGRGPSEAEAILPMIGVKSGE
jgi:hypothetical protein